MNLDCNKDVSIMLLAMSLEQRANMTKSLANEFGGVFTVEAHNDDGLNYRLHFSWETSPYVQSTLQYVVTSYINGWATCFVNTFHKKVNA